MSITDGNEKHRYIQTQLEMEWRLNELVGAYPADGAGADISAWFQEVSALSPTPEFYLRQYRFTLEDAPHLSFTPEYLAEHPDIERVWEVRLEALTAAALEKGATWYDINRAEFTAEPDQAGRQSLFGLKRSDGFPKLTYEDVGHLMREFGLVWVIVE